MGQERGELRVLAVDDDRFSRLFLVEVLDGANCLVLTASDGTEAVEILEGEPVDLLITDYEMPRMNGLDLIRWSKARFPHVAAVLITGQDPQALAAQGQTCGVLRILSKPVSVENLRSLVGEIRGRVPPG